MTRPAVHGPVGPYDVVLADPPWSFNAWNGDKGTGRTADSHYRTMSQRDLCALDGMLAELCAPRCVLWLWSTCSAYREAQEVMAAWGFTFRTVGIVWVKLGKAMDERASAVALAEGDTLVRYRRTLRRLHFGMGHYTRAGAELCLIGTRGTVTRESRSERQVLHAPVLEHSRKPDEQYPLIEAIYPGRRYLELFARRRRDGWAAWGDELNTEGKT